MISDKEIKRRERKAAIKKLKEKEHIKSQLRGDIAYFLSRLETALTPNPQEIIATFYLKGFKGYGEMRNKDLLSKFETTYNNLFNLKEHIALYGLRNKSWGDWHQLYGAGLTERRAEFAEEAETLMTRLFEEAVLL